MLQRPDQENRLSNPIAEASHGEGKRELRTVGGEVMTMTTVRAYVWMPAVVDASWDIRGMSVLKRVAVLYGDSLFLGRAVNGCLVEEGVVAGRGEGEGVSEGKGRVT